MDKLESMQVYVCVVDSHGFARAAEVLGLPRSTVSRVIKELEAYLGIQLLQRTTRKLSVTVDGHSYYTECKRLLAEIATLESSFPGRFAQPRGRFKVGMPQSLARHCIIPGLPEFLQQYPGLDITICSSDDVEDIIQEGYDCAIRTGRIDDSTTLVARELASFRWAILASPDYIAAHGRPETLDQLEQHRAVGYLNHRTGRSIEWHFSLAEGDYALRMKETLVVDDTDAYIQAGIQGLGSFGLPAIWLCRTCAAARWSPVWRTSLPLCPFRWFIRKTDTFLLRYGSSMRGAKRCYSRRSLTNNRYPGC